MAAAKPDTLAAAGIEVGIDISSARRSSQSQPAPSAATGPYPSESGAGGRVRVGDGDWSRRLPPLGPPASSAVAQRPCRITRLKARLKVSLASCSSLISTTLFNPAAWHH